MFSKKKQEVVDESSPNHQPAQPTYAKKPAQPTYAKKPAQPTYAKKPAQPTYAKKAGFTNEGDNYGDEDRNGELIIMAGKVGKAQHNFFRESEQAQQPQEYLPISSSELAQHITAQSAWLSLNGTVYDVTKYLNYHPGGRLILQGCGKECSDLFNKYHAWVNGDFMLKKYKLGYLIRDD